MQFAVAADVELEEIGQRIDDGHTDAMQSTGNLVGGVVELSARMQHGHDDLGRGDALFAVNVDRNAAAVVGHGDGFIGMNSDHHAITMARQRLVDGVIDHLEHHVVQAAAVVGVADVHSGSFSDGVKTL